MGAAHGITATDHQVRRLAEHVATSLGQPWSAWPGGWPGEAEAALIDAVFSIRARYGGPATGVRGVVGRWRERRGGSIDDLAELARMEVADVVGTFDNASRTADRPKALAVIEAAQALTEVGMRHASQLGPTYDQARAYCGVRGLGPVTWSYFCMLLGKPDIKADTWVVRFVNEAIGRAVTAEKARTLLTAVAKDLDVNETQLDHAIWSHARSAGTSQVDVP